MINNMNLLSIFFCAIAGMIMGFIWYGPLFGRAWMKIIGFDGPKPTKEEMKEMNKKMMPTYLIQFSIILLEAWILKFFIGLNISRPVHLAFGIWLGFIVPAIAGIAMWSGKSRKTIWSMFMISSGFQLVSIIIFSLILGILN